MYAWLSAFGSNKQQFFWPDGTDIRNCASNATNVQDSYDGKDGPATMLSGNNVIQRSAVYRFSVYPLLCYKY
jgi:hypothetical protein